MSVRNLKLGFRIAIYTVVMLLIAGLFFVVLYFTPWWPENLMAKNNPVLLTWLICFLAGLASMVIVEPFRRPGGSPYGFLIGGAVRTIAPLILIVLFVAAHRPIAHGFWIYLLIAYFAMLSTVIPLTLPAESQQKSTSSG